MDYSPPGSHIHGIFQAIVLEWVAISFSNQSFKTNLCPPAHTNPPPLFETFLTISVLQEASLLSALRNLDHPSFVIHYQLHSFSCG